MIPDKKQPDGISPFAQISAPKKRALLDSLAETGHVSASCEAVQISRSAVYGWRRTDAEFAKAFEMARSMAGESLIDAAMIRARDGVFRYKFTAAGEPILDPQTGEPYREIHYSDTLLIFLLKCLKPETFSDKVTHQGPADGAIQHITKLEVVHVDDWYPKRSHAGLPADSGGSPAGNFDQQREDEIAALRQAMGQNNSGSITEVAQPGGSLE